jgi:hypothetical protein
LFGLSWEVAARVGLLVTFLGVCVVVAVRDRPSLAFRVAVLTLVIGTPATYINTYLLLLPALAPSLWPVRDTRPRPVGQTVPGMTA